MEIRFVSINSVCICDTNPILFVFPCNLKSEPNMGTLYTFLPRLVILFSLVYWDTSCRQCAEIQSEISPCFLANLFPPSKDTQVRCVSLVVVICCDRSV